MGAAADAALRAAYLAELEKRLPEKERICGLSCSAEFEKYSEEPDPLTNETWTNADRINCLRSQDDCDHRGPDWIREEIENANYFGVSHFPCCITNFPQGWPKFAQSTVYFQPNGTGSGGGAIVLASLVPLRATVAAVQFRLGREGVSVQ